MYILDEVDAALDMSHSKPALDLIAPRAGADLLCAAENIGRLFRTRFKGSQFIVVSLKDGLFSNANGELRLDLSVREAALTVSGPVLFRARFRDGTSVVERTSQRSASGLYDKENVNPRGGRLSNEAQAGGK